MLRAPTEGPASAATPWEAPPETPCARAGEIHVWRIPLSVGARTGLNFHGILSREERERAERCLVQAVRNRLIAAHGRLRILLGRYLGLDPRRLQFRTGPRGKPYLAGSPPLQFNLAHSGNLALAAITREVEAGVDLERHRSEIAGEAIARRFFSPAETAWLLGLAEAARLDGFYRIWTAKEAFVKAHGAGLGFGLQEFTVAVGERWEVVEVRGDQEEARRWSLWRLDPGEGYTGAAAVRAQGLRLRCYDWPPEWDEV